MSDNVQVGLRVDRDVYEEFKQTVKERRGRWQGTGGNELENAMRHYIRFGADKPLPDMIAEANRRLARIEGAVGTAESDGGTDVRSAETHTHAPEEKPDHHAPRDKKVAYLVAQLRDDMNGIPEELPKERLREIVKDEYGFRSDTAKGYVDELREKLGLVDHPTVDHLLATPERRTEIIEQQTDDELETL